MVLVALIGTCVAPRIAEADVPPLQIIVLDKLDYCATMRNLDSIKGHKNMKARMPPPPPALTGSPSCTTALNTCPARQGSASAARRCC